MNGSWEYVIMGVIHVSACIPVSMSISLSMSQILSACLSLSRALSFFLFFFLSFSLSLSLSLSLNSVTVQQEERRTDKHQQQVHQQRGLLKGQKCRGRGN